MKTVTLLVLGLSLAGTPVTPRARSGPAPQEESVRELIQSLGAPGFEDQGRAANSLDRMGRGALPLLRMTRDDSNASERVRTWCRWIIEGIETREKRYKELIEKLASPDDEVNEAAEEELRKAGRDAVRSLLDLRKSEDKNLRRRAERLVRELGTEVDLSVWEGKILFADERPPNLRAGNRSDSSVLSALKWLARHQNRDGSWSATGYVKQCVGARCQGSGDAEFDAGLTGLALLAFLGAGYSHLSKDEFPDSLSPGRTLRFGDVVKEGLKWILSRQDPDGRIGGRGTKYMYGHAIAAAALVEAYDMSSTQLFKGAAQQAVDFILAAQNPGRAWRYTKRSGDNDTSVTGWAILALRSAEQAELKGRFQEAYEGAVAWLDEVTDATLFHRAGYNGRATGKVFVPGENENHLHHETMTAIAVSSRIFMSKQAEDPALGGVALLVKDLPEWKADAIDFYYWHHASLALFQYDGPEGPHWKKWNEAVKNALVPNQKGEKDGCALGSWESGEDRWGFEGGRVYAVAINALTLESPYRYPIRPKRK